MILLKSGSSLRGMRGQENRVRGRGGDGDECCGDGRGWGLFGEITCGDGRGWGFSRPCGEGMGTHSRPGAALYCGPSDGARQYTVQNERE